MMRAFDLRNSLKQDQKTQMALNLKKFVYFCQFLYGTNVKIIVSFFKFISVELQVHWYTTEVVANCFFGIDSNCFTKEKSVLLTMGTNKIDTTYLKTIHTKLITYFPIIKRFWKMGLVSKKTENFFFKLTLSAIKMRRRNESR